MEHRQALRPRSSTSTALPEVTDTGRCRRNGAALEVRDLVVTFPGPNGPIQVVKGISFSVPAGEFIGIVGESGSGKTMTMLAVSQLIPYPGRVSGTISLHGQELRKLSSKELDKVLRDGRRDRLPGSARLAEPALTIGTQLMETPIIHGGLSKKQARDLAISSLTEVHIPAANKQIQRYPHEFSGGMRQRAMIAMGLMKEPRCSSRRAHHRARRHVGADHGLLLR